MEEVVLEKVEKEKVDRLEARYHEAGNSMKAPSEKQKAYMITLARTVGLRFNVSKIRDKAKASQLIERLKALNRQMNGKSLEAELRDKRVAFGMATKLVFRRYQEQQKEPMKWKRFWADVEAFYRTYTEEQEKAVLDAGVRK